MTAADTRTGLNISWLCFTRTKHTYLLHSACMNTVNNKASDGYIKQFDDAILLLFRRRSTFSIFKRANGHKTLFSDFKGNKLLCEGNVHKVS